MLSNRTAFYRFVVPDHPLMNGEDLGVEIDTCGSTFDTVLEIYIVSAIRLALIEYNDDAEGVCINGLHSQITPNLRSGTYIIAVKPYQWDQADGSIFNLNVECQFNIHAAPSTTTLSDTSFDPNTGADDGTTSTTPIIASVCVVVVLLILGAAIFIDRRLHRDKPDGQMAPVALASANELATVPGVHSISNRYEVPTTFNPSYGTKDIVPPVYAEVSASEYADLSGSQQPYASLYEEVDERSGDYLHVSPIPAGPQAYQSLEEHQLYSTAPKPDADADYQLPTLNADAEYEVPKQEKFHGFGTILGDNEV